MREKPHDPELDPNGLVKLRPVDEVTTARIRRAAREGRVENVPRDRVGDYRQQVDRILRDIGFPEALVSDESCFSDFPIEGSEYGRLSSKYGFEIRKHDRRGATIRSAILKGLRGGVV